jgi:hypothetical protein
MKEEICDLIAGYKRKIRIKQKQIEYNEKLGKGGVCISINGEIQMLNAVISDLQKIAYK